MAPAVRSARTSTTARGSLSGRTALAIFQTGVGTRALFETALELGLADTLARMLDHTVVAVRGPKPTAVLRGQGVRIDRTAAAPYTTHELLAAIADVPIDGQPVLVQRYGESNASLNAALEARGAEVVVVPAIGGKTDLAAVARLLAERGFNEVTVETGAKLGGSLLRAGVIDEIVLYVAPVLLGDAAQGLFALATFEQLGEAIRPRIVDVRAVGADLRITARLET